jgi:hypothetical protein
VSKSRSLLVALAVYTVLAVVCFRPLFFDWNSLPTYLRGSTPSQALADRNLNVWILAWVTHALTTDPSQLFQGNILYPAPDTLAGSEHMLAHVPFTVPTWLLTHNAAYVLKVMMLESIVLTALAGFLVVRHHTGDVPAALLAGVLLTLSPWRYEPRGVSGGVAAEPQYLGFQFLPLALLAIAIFIEKGRRSAFVGFVAAMALQALASFYLGYVAFATVPFYALALLLQRSDGSGWRGLSELDWRRVRAVVTAFLVAALLVVPMGIPYLRSRSAGVVPSYAIDFVATLSPRPWSYLTPWGFALVGMTAAVLGFAFAAVRLVGWLLGRGGAAHPGERAAWVLLAAGLILGWGPYQELPGGIRVPLPFYALYALVPGFSAMRGAGRFVVVVSLGLSLAAGYAVALLRPRLGRAYAAVVALLIALTAARASWTPVQVEPGGVGADAAPVYKWLAARPPGEPVLELPAKTGEDDLSGLAMDSRFMLASTVHWQPLLNGYTAYEAPSRYVLAALGVRLPQREALDRLVSLVDVRWIVVHRKLLDAEQREAFDAGTPGLREAARFGDDVVYEVTAKPVVDRRATLLDPQTERTLEGTSRAPLAAQCRSGRIEVSAPRSVRHTFRKSRLAVQIENQSDCVWPALGLGTDRLVMLDYEWLRDGKVALSGAPVRLGGDVAQHSSLREPLLILTPAAPGPYRLRVTLRQQGDPAPIATDERDVELTTATPQ